MNAEQAELVFHSGAVHTVDAANTIAQAVAVAGGRILAVGADAEVRPLIGAGTRTVDLHGRSLLPGFTDAHGHFTGVGSAMSAIDCKAPGMQSIKALQEEVRKRAAAQPPGTWIRGRGYDQSRLAESGTPTAPTGTRSRRATR